MDYRLLFPARFRRNGGKGTAPDQENRLSRWGYAVGKPPLQGTQIQKDYGKSRGIDDARIFLIIFRGNVIYRLVRDSLVEVLMDWNIWGKDGLFSHKKVGHRNNQDCWGDNLQCMEPKSMKDYARDGLTMRNI